MSFVDISVLLLSPLHKIWIVQKKLRVSPITGKPKLPGGTGSDRRILSVIVIILF
jgi:hypothetical protein